MNGKKVLILIDSGGSHNFTLVDLGVAVEATPPYKVCLGDRHKKLTRGSCRNIIIKLEKLVVEEKFYLFKLGGVDLIIGVTWLASLGEVQVNWET